MDSPPSNGLMPGILLLLTVRAVISPGPRQTMKESCIFTRVAIDSDYVSDIQQLYRLMQCRFINIRMEEGILSASPACGKTNCACNPTADT